jgi:DNA repair exonuclease SbcCD nuclease subunit
MALESVTHSDHSLSYKTALLLHCNYNLSDSFATETSLNLKEEHVEELLTGFDYILLGHEHQPAELFDGRLLIVGNTHPTGFADISDKRILVWDGKEFASERIWDQATGYAELDWRELPLETRANFLRVTGKAETNEVLSISKQVSALWEKSYQLYGVKMELQLPETAQVDGQKMTHQLHQLPEIVRRELEAQPKLLALWDELVRGEE